ncbi:peptidase domain-containing ABC transporter [Flavobacterium sp. ACN6]|uniref:peptidase domain-containing ABC transporter n=1 Tax=Flavobacterium sp. ACN6 TaxID=1920426 RepID=UPI000BB2D42E|nr:peptidase domain-containing ABC transporter [Flavobacterium sp. ACN6]PBJ06639.1 Lactococcin-G-processing and transport ATP-binding protein LagD [Flavobacterium sp. ACN6]
MISKHIKNTHTLQLDRSDCGVACLLSIIKFYKGNYSLEKHRELSGTTSQGTTMLGLYEVANKLGFDADGFNISIDIIKEHGEPAILQIKTKNNYDHYVICYGYNKQQGFIIGDPAKGVKYVSETHLDKFWQSKNCLFLSPNSKFVAEKEIEKTKKKYFINLLRDDFKLLLFSTIIGVFVAGLGMAMSIFSQKLIDDILPSNNIKKLVSGIALLSILLFARVGLSILRQHFLIQQSKDFNNRINNTFFSSLLQLPKLFFNTRKIGELIARLNDTQRIQNVIKTLSSSLVIDTLVALISLVFLFSYSWELGIISLLSLPIYFYIIYRNNKSIIQSQLDVMQNYALTESNFINTIQGISTIKNNNKQSVFDKLNQNIFSGFQEKIFNLGKINISLSWQSGFASVIFLIGVLIYASIQVFNNEIKIGELMAVLGIVSTLLPSIANLALISIPINEAKIAFSRMYEFASIEKENEEGLEIFEINKISIQNLSFRFAGRSVLFHDINIEIEKGKFIAIVGESGSGKSTLGQILKRFYQFENGSIIINNKYKLPEIGLKSYRDLLGVVPQEIAIFNGNVLDNILLGSSETLENMLAFIREYGFEFYFDQLPQGMLTILGEEGINLSGGQKQIIALARALYKKPQFLIMDEATSAMDRNTENFTIKLLQKIKEDCAVFFISHRLNKLRNIADMIYILENKTILRSGNHKKLMETSNFYSEYWSEQFNLKQ